MRVLITGATGFVGQALSALLIKQGFQIRSVIRSKPDHYSHNVSRKAINTAESFAVGSIGPHTNWSDSLRDIDTVIHLAARVHVMNDRIENPVAAYREVNTAGTELLAKEAAKSGARRFIYLSTIKVNGEETGLRTKASGLKAKNLNKYFSESDIPHPKDPYAISKWEAEDVLRTISSETLMEVVIVRPPLVYGPGVKANFLNLLKIADKGIPLPLGSINNARSFVSLDNLIDFITCCIKHPAAAGETFLVSDGEDLSTPELIKKIAQFMGRPCRLFPFPPNLLHIVGKLIGKSDMIDRLTGSLQVDISKAQNVLGWKPPMSVDAGLRKTVDWYKKRTEC